MKKAILTLAALLAAGSVAAQSTSQRLELHNYSDTASVLYAYLPKNPCGRAVVACPGGGYSHLALTQEGHDWAEYFNKQGISYFVLKYRMPGGDRNLPLEDAYSAIKMVRDSAKAWHINPYDVGIMGFSAGGHLASAVSTHADWKVRPNFSILFYPVVSMNEKATHKGSVKGFLGNESEDKELVKEWSTDKAVRPHLTPRAVIILANDDKAVPPVTNGVAYYTAMRNCGNECSLMIYPHGGHGFGARTSFPYHDLMENQLTSWLNSFKAPKEEAVRVACIGNSITDGFGIDMSDEKGYPAKLQGLLGDGYNVKNFGVSSRTLLNKGDYPYQKEEAWHDALAFEPNIVVIKLGTNDSKGYVWKFKDDFQKDYKQMIDSLKALPSNPKIYICTPITGQNEKWGITDKVITEEVIPEIQKVAKKNKVELIDLHTLFKVSVTENDKEIRQLQKDGVHPTEKGAEQLAELIMKAIK